MSATMSRRIESAWSRNDGLIKGVCATVADRAGLPVWMPRTAFLVFGVLHWFLAVVLYVILARVLCPARRHPAGLPTAMPSGPASVDVRDRFGALDARLANLEAATLQTEATLRRQFRDLERG
jgi:phage shock protein PspC (stress-responsive transcriptional regulator)